MKLNFLAKNLVIAIEELAKDEKLVKLLTNYTNTPLNNNDKVNLENVLNNNIFLEPYNTVVPQEQKVELRVFYVDGEFDGSNNVGLFTIYFQIISHRKLERILINNEKTLRSAEIIQRIVDIFMNKHFAKISKVQFQNYEYGHIDKDYLMYTLSGVSMLV